MLAFPSCVSNLWKIFLLPKMFECSKTKVKTQSKFSFYNKKSFKLRLYKMLL